MSKFDNSDIFDDMANEAQGQAPSSYLDGVYDMDLEIKSAKVDVSQNPKKRGQVYFAASLEVRDVRTGDYQPGDSISFVRFIQKTGNEMKERRDKRECNALVASALGIKVGAITSDILRAATTDDGAQMAGCVLSAKCDAANDRGFYNPTFAHVSRPQ